MASRPAHAPPRPAAPGACVRARSSPHHPTEALRRRGVVVLFSMNVPSVISGVQ